MTGLRSFSFRSCIWGAALLFTLSFVVSAESRSLVIIHTNDRHGHVLPVLCHETETKVGGARVEASLIENIRQTAGMRGADVLFFDSGDFFQGTPLVNETQGEVLISVLNHLRMDGLTLGNHEFDYGLDVLVRRIQESDFHWVSSNVHSPLLEDLIVPYLVFETDGCTVGVLGVTTPDTPSISMPTNVDGVVFTDPREALPPLVDLLRMRGVDLIVVLSHMGLSADRRLARQVAGVDLVIGGHSHSVLHQPVKEGGTWIVQAGGHGRYVGAVTVTFDGEDISVSGELHDLHDATLPTDATMAGMLEDYRDSLTQDLERVVGVVARPLLRRGRGIESPLGVICAEAYREAVHAQIGFMNVGGVRDSLPVGPVTLGDLKTVSPFGNSVMRLLLSGSQIEKLLEHSVAGIFADEGDPPPLGYLVGSGIRYVVDPQRASGSRIVSLTVGGVPIDSDDTYVVATNSFLALGGDGFDEFTRALEVEDSGIDDVEALVSYFSSREYVEPLERGGFVLSTQRNSPREKQEDS